MNALLDPIKFCVEDTSIYELDEEELKEIDDDPLVKKASDQLNKCRSHLKEAYGSRYMKSCQPEEKRLVEKLNQTYKARRAMKRRQLVAAKIKKVQASLPTQMILDPDTGETRMPDVIKVPSSSSAQSNSSQSAQSNPSQPAQDTSIPFFFCYRFELEVFSTLSQYICAHNACYNAIHGETLAFNKI
ncbi:hypothetical protein LRAMOSA05987 [Lichtheimia ramosa]|uniref:Uncharacterized protein n=1 Tax=Lichtheimia ramosa TaxID=688394 RepID=A0A077X3F1_9FUNG|nr:hypothetical protein LRAMOSA05987 [Lichtheimia ramosa]